MKGLQIVHQALSLLVRNFLCESVQPCPVWLSFQISAILSVPFHVREKGRNVLLESNAGSILTLQGLLSCSQMSLSYKQSRCISPPTPPSPQWPSQHSWALSEMAVKCTVKRRDGQTPLNGKEDTHQLDSVVQSAGLFISDHQRVCLLYGHWVSKRQAWPEIAENGWWAKMNIQGVRHTSAPVGICLLSCCPILKLPFHSSICFPCAKETLILNLFKIGNVCNCLLGSVFFKNLLTHSDDAISIMPFCS